MNRKLDEATALAILRRVASGERQKDLAVEFKVTEAAISALVTGRTWPHLSRSKTEPKQRGRKLDEKAVLDILIRRAQGVPRRQLAAKYDVTSQTIADIEHRRTWQHVQRPQPTRRRVWES